MFHLTPGAFPRLSYPRHMFRAEEDSRLHCPLSVEEDTRNPMLLREGGVDVCVFTCWNQKSRQTSETRVRGTAACFSHLYV